MSDIETLSEVIAFLDAHERALERMRRDIREYRYMLYAGLQTLDTDISELLD